MPTARGSERSAVTEAAAVVVFAVGNESRGDDGLGHALAARLVLEHRPGVELVLDFQLQVEHALALAGRRRAVFVDAGQGTAAPFELRRLEPSPRLLHTTHALAPEAVLEAARRIGIQPPEAWLLCIRGEQFELGDGLSAAAERNLAAAVPALLDLL